MAPEVFRERTGSEVKKSDIWAVGVLSYFLLTGEMLFQEKSLANFIQELTAMKKLEFPESVMLSESCMDFVKHLLKRKAKKRLSAQKALHHDWIGFEV